MNLKKNRSNNYSDPPLHPPPSTGMAFLGTHVTAGNSTLETINNIYLNF